MAKFKVGDIVKSVSGDSSNGLIGVVVETDVGSRNEDYLCRFIGFEGHNGDMFSKGSYYTDDYWYLTEDNIELVSKFYVKCKTEERLGNVLQKAEKLGYVWGDRARPTNWKPDCDYNEGIVVFFNDHKEISYSNFSELKLFGTDYTKVKYKVFVSEDPEQEQVARFEPGKRYFFDVEKMPIYICPNGWEKECDGKKVTVDSDGRGYIGIYEISPNWCREISESDFKIGDAVKVIDTGKMYSTRIGTVQKIANGDADILTRFAFGYSPYTENIYTLPGKYIIKGIDDNFVLIQRGFTGKVLLIDKKGLKRW